MTTHEHPHHIDLTQDDDEDEPQHVVGGDHGQRLAKRPRMDDSVHSLNGAQPARFAPSPFCPPPQLPPFLPGYFMQHAPPPPYRPPFAGIPPSAPQSRSPSVVSAPIHPVQQQTKTRIPFGLPDKQIIDLTDSPSPPPEQPRRSILPLPLDLPPRTPVCIGQLTVNALILYPVPYLSPSHPRDDWGYVRLHYEHNPLKESEHTIHIRTPNQRNPNGEIVHGESFAMIETPVAKHLGPMLAKGCLRLDGQIRRMGPNLPIVPLNILVYTPNGNIRTIGDYLKEERLLLNHPGDAFSDPRYQHYHYYNPHGPPPGGWPLPRRIPQHNTWLAPQPAKSVEIQRGQVDEFFTNLNDGEDLAETEPVYNVATKLYPHQKRALTFLLDREQERPATRNGFSSLWELRLGIDDFAGQHVWTHKVTKSQVPERPVESKGAILADDMGLGKTITCVSIIAHTLPAAQEFAASPLEIPQPPSRRKEELERVDPINIHDYMWYPEASSSTSTPTSTPPTTKAKAKEERKEERLQDKLEAQYIRRRRIKTKSRATLVVCPLSIVSNWEDQFRDHWRGEVTVVGGGAGNSVPIVAQPSTASAMQVDTKSDDETPKPKRVKDGTPLRIYIYHGNSRRPDPSFLADFDIVITTYATLASEWSKQNKSIQEDDDEGESSEATAVFTEADQQDFTNGQKTAKKGLKRKKPLANSASEVSSALQSIHWFRVVLDEAHSIKETSTVACRACCDLIADRRLCLTGTPVQNKLEDVYALIKFLRLEPFDDKNVWTHHIGGPVKLNSSDGILQLRTVMACITLRRTKESKTQDGKGILDLPPRKEMLQPLRLDPEEKAIYDRFEEESTREFQELSATGQVMKNYVGILQRILRLRQICDHPDLVKEQAAGSISAESFRELEDAISKEGLTPTRAYAIFSILREAATTQCHECGVELCPEASNQADAEDEGSSQSTPGSGKGRGKRGRPVAPASTSRAPTRPSSPSSTSSPRPILTRCQHLYCLTCYHSTTCPNWPNVPPDLIRSCGMCQTPLSPSDAVEITSQSSAANDAAPPKKRSVKKQKRQKGVSRGVCRESTKIRMLMKDLMQFSMQNPHSANFQEGDLQLVDANGKPSDDAIVKTVVFSQWTTMLDKIEDSLEMHKIQYDRLDGTMKRDERSKAMDALKYDPACEVLLVSLKAGGVGLNLTAAQRVYLMDPYWNPAVENQAVDRVHRLGQTRPVTIIKYIIENSIETRLLDVQKKKLELAQMTFGKYSKAEAKEQREAELGMLMGTITGQSRFRERGPEAA